MKATDLQLKENYLEEHIPLKQGLRPKSGKRSIVLRTRRAYSTKTRIKTSLIIAL